VKIALICPACNAELEVTPNDNELRAYLASCGTTMISKTRYAELMSKAKEFAQNFSKEGDAQIVIFQSTATTERSADAIDRFYEYAYVIKQLRKDNTFDKNILDMGSAFTVLPTILASLGYHVTCMDVVGWEIPWPDVKVIKCDLLEPSIFISPESFDYITCVSTIEHVGLGRYGDKESTNGDFEGMKILHKYLKPGGRMILTIPVGLSAIVYPAHRIYNRSRFLRLISGFRILNEEFFFRKPEVRGVFYPCSSKKAYLAKPFIYERPGYAIACCLLEKEEDEKSENPL